MADYRTRLSREDAATSQLHLWLGALNRTLKAAVSARSALIARVSPTTAPPGCLSGEHAAMLGDGLEARLRNGATVFPPIALDKREAEAEAELIRAGPVTPPLLRLSRDAGLDTFEQAALLICVAPEIAPAFRRLYGFVVDDMARSHASLELILALSARAQAHGGQQRRKLGPGGALRRLGLVRADDMLSTRLSLRLEPAAGLVDWLLGTCAAPPVPLRDPQLLWPDPAKDGELTPPMGAAVRCLAGAVNGAVGLWGSDPNRHDDAVLDLAAHLKHPVYRSLATGDFAGWSARFRQEAAVAADADAILWIDTRALPSLVSHGRAIADILGRLPQRIVLTGRIPWRPVSLIGARPFADVAMSAVAPSGAQWALPHDLLPQTDAAKLSQRYRLGWRERRAALQLALSERRNLANGTVPDLGASLERACKLLSRPAHLASVVLVEPERHLKELILPPDLHRQIAEIGSLYAHARQVDTDWGFGRIAGSSGALKALFTGDPGTGKTMAAEVIAGAAGVSLMKVDLSQVVSKWVGETEKNLEAVFDHAEQSNAALFFDEADALFGKRGEVRHGTDRYANLEVSFLLQRLESFSGGLVILASNQRDEIDPAFTRRFQIALNFPRPGKAERLRLWQMAFSAAPLCASATLEQFADLELTGGAIVTAARMAALLAAGDGESKIGMAHIAAATERQFRKEARLMAANQQDGLSVAQART